MARPRSKYGYSALLENYHPEHQTTLCTLFELHSKTRAHLYILLIMVCFAADLSHLRRYEKSCSRLLASSLSSVEILLMNLVVRPMNLPARQT